MTNMLNIARNVLHSGAAFQALALLGAGVGVGAIAVPAAAQDYQNVTAAGKVQGTDGKPIAGATVAITSNGQGFTRTVTTESDGSYRVPQLPIGSYTFNVSADGYDAFSDANVTLSQNASGNAFTLAPAGAGGGEVVVTAGRVQVADFEQGTTGAVINVSDLANRAPIARDITSVVLLSPGTNRGDTAFGNLPSIAGASVGENQFFVNGLNITNFRNFLGSNAVPFEFYDTVEVKNGGFPAEFGRATGGFVNATTKSGSNDFHAGVVATYQPNGLRSTAKNTETQDNDNDYRKDLRSDFYLSGPIIKDHLFFYGLYESRDVKNGDGTTDVGGDTYTVATTTSPFFAGKIDAVITDGQRLEFTYFRTTSETYNDVFSYDPNANQIGAYQVTNLTQAGGDNFVGRYTGTFAKWLTVSGAYGRSNDRQNATSTQPGLSTVIDYRTNDAGTLVPGTNPITSVTTNADKREFYRGDVDLYFSILGSHHVRGGYDHENLTTDGGSSYTGDAYYEIYNTPGVGDYITRRTFETGGKFGTVNEAFYAEDTWQLFSGRLTLDLGIRNDRFTNRNAAGQTFYSSGDQWGPRVGFAFDPVGDRRTKFYGSFGRYFLPIAANTNVRLAGAEYDVTDYFRYGGQGPNGAPILGAPLSPADITDPTLGPCIRTTANNCYVVSDGTVANTANTIATNLKPQSVDEYILGGEQRIGRRVKVGAYFTYTSLNRALEDSAIDLAAIAYCNSHGLTCANLYGGFSQYVLNNPGSEIATTLLDGTKVVLEPAQLGYPKAQRVYKAMTFTFDREFDGKWGVSGSYTLSANVGNYEGGVKSDIGQADTGLTEDFDQPGFTYGAYGYLPNHHRHNLKLYGSYKLFDWLTLGADFQALSPRKFGCLGTIPRTIDRYANAYGPSGNYCRFADGTVSNANPIVLVPRGTAIESDWDTPLDIGIQVRLPVSQFNAVLRLDVFNVLNNQPALELNNVGSLNNAPRAGDPNPYGANGSAYSATSDYGVPITYDSPRYARVQLQLRF